MSPTGRATPDEQYCIAKPMYFTVAINGLNLDWFLDSIINMHFCKGEIVDSYETKTKLKKYPKKQCFYKGHRFSSQLLFILSKLPL